MSVKKLVEDIRATNTSSLPFRKHNYCWKVFGWCLPQEGWIKISVDGSVRQGGNQVACEGVYRDEHSKWLGGFARNLSLGNVLMAELYATLMALDLAWDKGFQVGVDRV